MHMRLQRRKMTNLHWLLCAFLRAFDKCADSDPAAAAHFVVVARACPPGKVSQVVRETFAKTRLGRPTWTIDRPAAKTFMRRKSLRPRLKRNYFRKLVAFLTVSTPCA